MMDVCMCPELTLITSHLAHYMLLLLRNKMKRKEVAMHVLRKCGLFLLLMLTVSMGVLVFSSPKAAHAAISCHASTCKNLDPTTTVGPDGVFCNKDAAMQEQANTPSGGGYVQNWFSFNCDANWTVAQAPSGTSLAAVDMELCQGTASGFTCNGSVSWYTDSIAGVGCATPIYQCNAGSIPTGATHWFTNMVDGSGPVLSLANFRDASSVFTHYH